MRVCKKRLSTQSVFSMPAYLCTSKARRGFKDVLGQANHLVITALVGLDAIERGIVREVPADLRAAWSPKDPLASARRSRRLLLDMALVRSVDALDMYLRYSNRKPFLFQSQDLREKIDGAHWSIFRKVGVIEGHYSRIEPMLFALVNIMIAWRNRAAHFEADNDASPQHKQVLRDCFVDIAMRFRNLDTARLLSGYEAYDNPTFKEVASFVNATQHFVEALERAQFSALNAEIYLKELIWVAISRPRPSEDLDGARRRHLRSIWGKAPADRLKSIRRFLQQEGLSLEKPSEGSPVVIIDDALVDSLAEKTPTDMLKWARV